MIHRMPTVAVSLRALVDRRRFWLMVGLAAVPVLVMLAAVAFSDTIMTERRFDQLIVQTVLPLVALVFGTGTLGSEIDDGTIVYLLTKPISRWRILATKGAVAAGLTAALMVPATLLTGILATTQQEGLLGATFAYAIAVAVGGTAYALAFMALSAFTSKALAAGLAYVLIWEGMLSGLFPATQLFSIRQATLGFAAELLGADWTDTLDGFTSVVILSVVIVGALAIGTWRLSRYELRGD